jgi:hypothetical protein
MALSNDERVSPAAAGRDPLEDRLSGAIETNNQFFLEKASFQPRDWLAREAEDKGFDRDAIVSLVLEIAATMKESTFERACRLADQQRKPPAPVKSEPHHHITPKAPTPHPTKLRLRAFWREVMAAGETKSSTDVEAALMQIARECGLVAEVHKLGGHGEEDVRQVMRWGLRGWNPWGKEFPDGI